MRCLVLVLLASIAVGTFAKVAKKKPLDTSRFPILDQFLESSSGTAGSGWVALVKRGWQAYSKVAGYSNMKTKEKMSINSIFRICT